MIDFEPHQDNTKTTVLALFGILLGLFTLFASYNSSVGQTHYLPEKVDFPSTL